MKKAPRHKTAPLAKIIDGKAIAEKLRASISQHVSVLSKKHGITPGLAVILVGDDPASHVYVENKKKAAAKAGIKSFVHVLPKNTAQIEIMKLIRKFNRDKKIHGVLVQMPLPRHLDSAHILHAIDPAKDVDGLHIENMGRLIAGLPGMAPCTPLGCLTLIKSVKKNLTGLHAVIVGRSNLVGKPLAHLLLRLDCTVTLCHSKTPNLSHITRQGDILIAAAGRSGLIKAAGIKPGAIVIDVGINRKNGKITGDVDFSSASKIAGHITPVPGGVGPMTIACLLGNTVAAACYQNGIDILSLH